MLDEALRSFFSRHAIEPELLLVTVSGGADSVALLVALHEWNDRPFRIAAIHVNHHLRGDEADADQRFVEKLCADRTIELVVAHASIADEEIKRIGVEAAARGERYRLFRKAADELGADHIATAHQRDDQAETLILRFITGSGPQRLSGIAPLTRDGVIRPLLDVPRPRIEEFLAERNITPRLDRMNEDPRFPRTRIRREVLPLLRSINPAVHQALAETARLTAEHERDYRLLIARVAEDAVERTRDGSIIDLERVGDLPFVLRSVILDEVRRLDPEARDLSAADLRRIVHATQKRMSITRNVELERSATTLQLRRGRKTEIAFDEPIVPGEIRPVPGGGVRIQLDEVPAAEPLDTYGGGEVQYLEASVVPEFRIRSRRSGDRFQPLGSDRDKSLKDFLIDRKIARDRRDTLVLLTCDGEIAWISGVEVSENYKVRGAQYRFRAALIRDDDDANSD